MKLTSDEIKKYEEAGFDVLEISGDKITYQTRVFYIEYPLFLV